MFDKWMEECFCCFVFFNIFFFLCFIVIMWVFGDKIECDGFVLCDIVVLLVVLFFLLYVLYFMECYCFMMRWCLSVVKNEFVMMFIDLIRK